MKRTSIETDLTLFPAGFHSILDGAQVFDSSCSPQAKVYYIEKDGGFFLKSAGAGTLETEAEMTRYFYGKELAAEVLDYVQDQQDWLLTRRVPGEDCTHRQYMDDPKRLSEQMGLLLRQLHDADVSGCPIDRTKRYVDTAIQNFHTGSYDRSLFPDNWGYRCAEDAFRVVQEMVPHLKADTLLHGDYYLPNVILTPHTTPMLPDREERMLDYVLKNLEAYCTGGAFVNRLTVRDMYSHYRPDR